MIRLLSSSSGMARWVRFTFQKSCILREIVSDFRVYEDAFDLSDFHVYEDAFDLSDFHTPLIVQIFLYTRTP
jgi:hypothetical protein